VRIAILGPLSVEQDGRPIEISGGRLKALLARLAIDVGRPVSATALADAIWDGALPADEAHALQSLVSRLRRALGDPGLIEQSASGYRLTLAPEGVDVAGFTRLAAHGATALRDGDPARAGRLLGEALSLWRGAALADVALSGWLAQATAALADLRVSAEADRAQAELALGRAGELVPALEELAAEHPLHERIAGQLMRALYASGRQADALAVYERVRAALADAIGAAPSPELQAIHQAVLTGEQAVASPRREAPRSNLAVRLTSFVGRDAELQRVGNLLHERRLLTLIGPGGAGKTRLSCEVADRAAARFGDGVWMVELAPVADAAGIAPAILGSLGLREVQLLGTRAKVATTDAASHLLEVLVDTEPLLILDNCEHLLEPLAPLVERLLGACPRLRILCTSREPLGITGEAIVPVAPLALPPSELPAAAALAVPAVRLFADRARAAAPGFVLDDETVGAVLDVCRRVDGLPLAIELAAARLRSMSLSQLAARLDDRFSLLTGGSRTAMARQRTLRAVVDWSWELLDERERALLRRLAVFAGGFALADVESVCAGDPVESGDVFDLLCALVDKSLVQLVDADTPRYRLLETIREYGLERLQQADELAATRTGHARHFAAMAIEAAPHLRGATQLNWLARLRGEHDNVLAALRALGEAGDAALVVQTVVALLWFWLLGGHRQEVVAWTEFARSVPGEADPLERVFVDGVHALATAMPGHPASADPWQALRVTLEQIEHADLSEHPLLAALRPLLAIAIGRERVLQLLELSARHPDPWVRATAPFVRVQLTENDGDLDGMRIALDESLEAFGSLGDRWGLAITLSELSTLRVLTGDLDGAEQALEQTGSLMAELGVSDGGGMVRMRLADVHARRGDLEGARAILQESLAERERFAEEQVMLKVSLAYVTLHLGDMGRARELATEALDELGTVSHGRPEQGHANAMALTGAAAVELGSGAPEAARRLLTEAYPAALGTADMPIVALVGVTVASLQQAYGRAEQAAEILGAAAGLRGADDATHPEVAALTDVLRGELGDEAFAAAVARGRGLDREAAIARLDPARLDPARLDPARLDPARLDPAGPAVTSRSDPAAVGAERERHEHDQQDRHPHQRPQDV
jgi:predicted ATPase/DNA-binding SARP family transcriptional activator